MNLAQVLKHIESLEFDVRFSVISGFRTVLNGFKIDETVQALIQLLRENPDNQLAVLERLNILIPDYQSDYMHTHDIPVCAYLYALYEVNSLGALEVVVHQIIEKKEFFWARKMAIKILEELNITTQTEIVEFQNIVSNDIDNYQIIADSSSTYNVELSA